LITNAEIYRGGIKEEEEERREERGERLL